MEALSDASALLFTSSSMVKAVWAASLGTSRSSFSKPSGWLPSSRGKVGSHAFQPGSHPWWPIWGSMIHHTAGGHVLWKGRELVTSLSPPAWMSNPFFFFCVPFLRPSPSQDGCCIQIIGLHSVRPGCQCSFWIEISSLVPRFPSDLPFRAPSLPLSTSPPRSGWVIIMTLVSQYNDMTSMVHYLQWVSWPGALSIDHSSLLRCLGDLWIQPAQHGTHSKWQPQGAFIPPAEFNHFSLSSFCLSAELFRV